MMQKKYIIYLFKNYYYIQQFIYLNFFNDEYCAFCAIYIYIYIYIYICVCVSRRTRNIHHLKSLKIQLNKLLNIIIIIFK